MLAGPREPLPAGLIRIRLPLPFELDHVYVHLLPLEQGFILVDTGLGSELSMSELEQALQAHGVSWEQIRLVFLTHVHPDHMGGATEILARTRAPLWMHRVEREQLESLTSGSRQPQWLDHMLHESGVPAPMVAAIEDAFRKVRRQFRPLQPDRMLEGGERIATALGEFQTLWTPGHSPGHLCLYESSRQLLLAGDHLLPDITPNIGWLPGLDTLADYRAALDRVAALAVGTILPSHGEPFRGHAAWIEGTKAHHDERCEELQRGLAGGERTANQLVGHLWDRPLHPFHHRFAVFEVLAHLVFLENLGRVEQNQRDGVTYWRNTVPVPSV